MTFVQLQNCNNIYGDVDKIENIVKSAKELGQTSLILADKGSLSNAIYFFEACIKYGIKPIIGVEVEIVTRVIKDSKTGFILDEIKSPIVLLCKNETGYKNLIKLMHCTKVNGLYYNRIVYDKLKRYSEGLICLSGGKESGIWQSLQLGRYEEAKKLVVNLKNIFKNGNLYLEIQKCELSSDYKIIEDIVRLSKEEGVEIIATNETTDLLCLCPEAIHNSQTLDDKCNVKIEFVEPYYSNLIDAIEKRCNASTNKELLKSLIQRSDYHMPKFDVPKGFTSKEYLAKLANEGLEEKYDLKNCNNSVEIKKRLEYELSIINEIEYADYLLIVADYVKYAKDNKIPVGPSIGAECGSLVCYAIGITDIDPIKYNLLFERFINIESKNIPDIYIDFSVKELEKVKKYIGEKYGISNVLGVLNNPHDVFIVPDNNENVVPQSMDANDANNNGLLISQYDLRTLEKLGFVKFGLLSIRYLDIMKKCLSNIENKCKSKFDINNISYDDSKVYEMISKGDITGIYPLESYGMTNYIKKLKPNKFDDLVMLISINRPGTNQYFGELVKRKNDYQMIEKIHTIYDDILKETYGMIVYQEQIILILNKLSGMQLERADTERIKLTKKEMNDIIEVKNDFIFGNDKLGIKGCINNGISEEVAKKVFDKLVDSAPNVYCKAHAIVYAKLAYQTAYLKCYYKEYITYYVDESNQQIKDALKEIKAL